MAPLVKLPMVPLGEPRTEPLPVSLSKIHDSSSPLYMCRIVCLALLRLNVQVNNLSVMLRRSHRFLGITSTFQGVNVSLPKDTTRRR